jgi:hypothetical protein
MKKFSASCAALVRRLLVFIWSWALEYGPKIETFDLSLCVWKLLALGGRWSILHAEMSSDDSKAMTASGLEVRLDSIHSFDRRRSEQRRTMSGF